MGNAAFHVVLMWVCMYGFLNQDFQDWDDAGESLVGWSLDLWILP